MISAAAQALAYDLPRFRQPAGLVRPSWQANAQVRLLADADFAPFSFLAQGGGPAGLAVELALAACTEAKIRCDVTLLPHQELVSALETGQGDAIISGVRVDEPVLRAAVMSRPWFRTMARFAVLSGNPAASADATALAGKRIGVLKDTVHARWLVAHYKFSETVLFEREDSAHEALRTGNIDAYFGDNLRVIFWVAGNTSKGCCKLLGGAFSDFDSYTRSMAYLVRADRADLREALDFGLDVAQDNGTAERIFNAYIPLSPW